MPSGFGDTNRAEISPPAVTLTTFVTGSYCQPSEHQPLALYGWLESDRLANAFMKMEKSKGLIVASQHCYQKQMHGLLPNRDTLVSIAA